MPDSPLRYIESPPRDPTGDMSPLLVTFHGFGSHMGDLHELRHAIDGRFHVLSVQAPIDLGPLGMPGGWAWFNLEFSPGDGIGYDERGALEVIERVEEFVLQQVERLSPSQLVLLGFSQGAMLAHALLLRGRVDPSGVAACSGRMVESVFGNPSATESLSDKPVFVSHGRMDDVIPIESGRAIETWYGASKALFEYHEYDMAHGLNPECLADLGNWCTKVLDSAI